jgi:hypothetical protein
MFNRKGERVDTELYVKDLVQSNLDDGLQMKYPICFDCYDKILANLNEIYSQQSSSMANYSEQLL